MNNPLFTSAVLALSMASTNAFAKNDNFEKVIKDGKTVYQKKASAKTRNSEIKQKVKVDMYLSTGCKKCVPAIMKILSYDTTFRRKNIDKKMSHKKELIKLAGDAKTPKIFINGKEIQTLSTAVIELELRNAGAKLKPEIKSSASESKSGKNY